MTDMAIDTHLTACGLALILFLMKLKDNPGSLENANADKSD